jgi:hypothetical protein
MCRLGDGKRHSTHVLADEHCALAIDTTLLNDATQPDEMPDPAVAAAVRSLMQWPAEVRARRRCQRQEK